MHACIGFCAALSTGLVVALPAFAEVPASGDKAPVAAPAQDTQPKAAPLPTEPLQAVVHGLFVQMRTGLGYSVVGGKIPSDPAFPSLAGTSEQMGLGALIDLAFGYEFNDLIALQLVGGVNLVTGRRPDRVRALSVAFGGAGLRISLPLQERLTLVLAPAVAYARSDTVVESATMGPLIHASAGLEYYVHLRHFSVGLDLVGVVPINPVRAFLGIAPHLRYTF